MVPPRDSPMSSHSIKQGDVYGNSTVAATPNQLAAEKRVSEPRAETSLKLEGDIYAAVVRPVLAYGCPVWFSLGDERANRNRLIYPLQTVQNKCLEPSQAHTRRQMSKCWNTRRASRPWTSTSKCRRPIMFSEQKTPQVIRR
jgi:hypothetical protein